MDVWYDPTTKVTAIPAPQQVSLARGGFLPKSDAQVRFGDRN